MTWKRLTVIRILLAVAALIEDDDAVRNVVSGLSTHISVNAPKPTDEAGGTK